MLKCCRIILPDSADSEVDEKQPKDDRTKLLNIFPEEIWMEILNNVVDHGHQEKICNSSPFFRNLLFDKRALFLFSKVWPIFSFKYETDGDDAYREIRPRKDDERTTDDEEYDPNSADPEVVSHTSSDNNEIVFWFHGLLKLRLVCKTWCNIIDNFYQTLPQYFEMTHDEDPNDDYSKLYHEKDYIGEWTKMHTFNDGDFEYLTKFMEHFENTHGSKDSPSQRSPMLARSVSLEYCDAEIEFVDFDFIPFLEKYGHHIWYLSITAEDDFEFRGDYYLKLREILELVPNLITLEIEYTREQITIEDSDSSREFKVDIPPSQGELLQLKAEIDENPLRKLRNLKFLKVENLLCPIFNEIIRANPHLSMLQVLRVKEVHDDYDIYSQPLPNLKQLSMMYFSKADFLKLEQVNWPQLEKLYICFNDSFFKWSKIFSLLGNKWEKSLTNVVLSLPIAVTKSDKKLILKESHIFRLNLPHVKRLKLILSNFSSLDFILPLRESLISLNIKTYYDAKKRLPFSVKEKQIVQFLGYFGDSRLQKRPYESNTWTIFEKLKRFNVGGKYVVWVGSKTLPGDVGHPTMRGYFCGGIRQKWNEKMEKITENIFKLYGID